MAKTEKQDIEDAEIIVPDGIKPNDNASNSRKFQFVLIYGLIFLLSASIFGLVIYSTALVEFSKPTKAMAAQVS